MHQRPDDRDRRLLRVDVAAIVERVLSERLDDGGWNCEVENGSVRSSFDTTINVLDGLLEFERATGGSTEVHAARRSGRSTCSSAACSVAGAQARSSIRRISTSRSPTTGTTTCCARSTTSAGRARTRIPGWRRPPRSWDRSGSPTAGGCSTASIRVGSTSTSRAASERPVAGTPSARSGCSIGGTGRCRRRDASAAARERLAHQARVGIPRVRRPGGRLATAAVLGAVRPGPHRARGSSPCSSSDPTRDSGNTHISQGPSQGGTLLVTLA